MKVKIVQPGWETYTGLMGLTEFVDGVSTGPVTGRERARLGAVVQVEDLDTGHQVGPATDFLLAQDTPAPVGTGVIQVTREEVIKERKTANAKRKAENEKAQAAKTAKASKKQKPGVEVHAVEPEAFDPAAAEIKRYDRAELEAIADEKGIGGLRPIAGAKGIKGNSIEGLIRAILAFDVEAAIAKSAE